MLHMASFPDGFFHGGGRPHHCAHQDLQPVPWAAPSGHAGTSVNHLDAHCGSGPEPLLLLLKQLLFPIIYSHSFL